MLKAIAMKSLLACLILSGAAAAQDVPAGEDSSPESRAKAGVKAEAQAPNRKAYDALYSDILRSLPKEGKMKVDSARGRERKPEADIRKDAPNAEEMKKEALEKRKKELDELPPEVKARVDKALTELDNRRREKRTEFKELQK